MLRKAAIASWSARTVEPFKNSPINGYARKKMSLPGISASIPNITFPNSPDFAPVARSRDSRDMSMGNVMSVLELE